MGMGWEKKETVAISIKLYINSREFIHFFPQRRRLLGFPSRKPSVDRRELIFNVQN